MPVINVYSLWQDGILSKFGWHMEVNGWILRGPGGGGGGGECRV